MSTSQPAINFLHGTSSVTGILITNLGTPDAPTASALRRYLGEFLWDPRVVDMSRPLWWLILHGVILRIRPRRSAHAYQKIWGAEGSPLRAISQHQARALQAELTSRFPGPIKVALGMRYGNPSLKSALQELQAAEARRILILPLYPQYSASTTASTFDAVADILKTWRWLPELRMVTQYHDNPDYIDALANSIRATWTERALAQRLLFSFHGIPKRYLLLGDPYHCQCHKTARLVAERLGLTADRWQVSFQSRFGREEWLQPYTDQTLSAWARAGIESVDVICPGFSVDCLETLEEMALLNCDLYLREGGRTYRYIAALNDHPEHIIVLSNLIERHTRGWPETDPDWNAAAEILEASTSREQALSKGALR